MDGLDSPAPCNQKSRLVHLKSSDILCSVSLSDSPMTQCFAWKTSLEKEGYDTLNVKIPDFVSYVYLTFGCINGNCNQTLRKSGLENK